MASGIYRLTFSSGKYYVGKSLDLETRWKQHFNKFATGKAARPMQLEYDRCGLPETEVIFHCHRDHIDIMEEWLIDQLKGPDMLNTTYPEVKRTKEIRDLIESSIEELKLSTWDHLSLIQKYRNTDNELAERAERAMNLVRAYRDRGRIVDEDYAEIVDVAEGFKRLWGEACGQIEDMEYDIGKYRKMSLWDRIFNYKV